MFTSALKKIFSPSTVFIVSGGFTIWGGLLATMLFRANTTGIASVAF